MANNGNGNGSGSGEFDPVAEAKKMTLDGFRELFPEAASQPLISGPIDSGNPGSRLLSNEETPTEMLKGFNFNDERQAALCALALGENELVLYNADGKINKEVQKIRDRIKYRAASQCSIKGQWVDQYKQTATGVITSTSGAKGWTALSQPFFKPRDEERNGIGSKFDKNKHT